MQKTTAQNIRPVTVKQKLLSAFFMLLFATVLMTSASYAWFELINATQAQHISANVGANGSLEVALLNTQTRGDMTTIRADIGDSMAENNPLANQTWGNLVDLGRVDYGLGNICLLPARLNVASNVADGSYTVDSSLLAVPTYGYDGRIVELRYNTVSAVFQEESFVVKDGIQDFGVRGIGTSDILSAQGSALAMAKSNISANTNQVKSGVITALGNSGSSLFNIVMFHLMDEGTTYTDEDRDAIKAVLEEMDGILQDIELALRQGLVAYAAAQIDDETVFLTAKEAAMDTSVELSQTLKNLEGRVVLPGTYQQWVSELDAVQTKLNAARIDCEELTGGVYSWAQIREIMNSVMNVDRVMINEYWFEELAENESLIDTLIEEMIDKGLTMTLKKDSGIYADIAEFVDDYRTVVTVEIIDILVVADNEEEPAYLAGLINEVQELKAAQSSTVSPAVPLTATYGYALDLAFRCNTEGADLLLQTAPRQRIYDQEGQASTSASTQGDGSYMAFHTFDKPLADAIRVSFVDEQGLLLGMAKLNTADRTEVDGMIRIPLQMYDYTFETDKAGFYLVMGDQPKTDPTIVTKEQMTRNIPKAVTVVVWLDGDIVDNTMVSATEQTSLSGVMNLQFATNAELIPIVDEALMHYTVNKAGMEELLADCEAIVEQGRGNHTTVSWQAFTEAYERAQTVFQEDTFRESQVRTAMMQLTEAKDGLDMISREPLTSKAAEVRKLTGTVDYETIFMAIRNEDDSISVVDPGDYTGEEMKDLEIVGRVYAVDSENNRNHEGNGIYTPIYTEDSWDALAAALYAAEALLLKDEVTEEQLDYALAILEAAEQGLERELFFRPYVYQNTIYYEAICQTGNADTYGKWYDSNFQRIVSDLTIVYLDAYAESAEAAEIRQDTYVASDADYINPEIVLQSALYQQLQNETMDRVQWNALNHNLFTERMAMRHLNAINDLLRIVKEKELEVDTTSAEKLVADFSNTPKPTVDTAANEIRKLNDAVMAALYQQGEYDAVISTDILYNVRYPDVLLELTGESGAATLDARILTQSGILISASKEIVIYNRADGLQIFKTGEQNPPVSLELAVDETAELTASLLYEAGGKNTGEKPLNGLIRENIKSFLWASDDTDVALVTGKDTKACTIRAVNPGSTEIGVLVETVEGNTYTWSIPLTVQ